MPRLANSAIAGLWRGAGFGAVVSLAAILAVLSGCATDRQTLQPTREYLDPPTGLTITAMSEPLIFAHAEPRISNTLRDYLYIGAFEVNRMGERSYYLWVGPFSTLDRSVPEFGQLTIHTARAAVRLAPEQCDLSSARPRTPPYGAPLSSSRCYYIPVSAELLAEFAADGILSIDTQSDGTMQSYTPWRAEFRDFQAFATTVNNAR